MRIPPMAGTAFSLQQSLNQSPAFLKTNSLMPKIELTQLNKVLTIKEIRIGNLYSLSGSLYLF